MEILIADDDHYSRRILQKVLEASGHQTILKENGLKAWEVFKEKDIRMVITDWMMPEMDGLALCQKIRAANLSHYVYLLLLTAKDKKKDAVAGLEAGADDYVVKPFEPGELLARIRSGQRIINLEDKHKVVQVQLLQSEKMSSIGQLAAGVAHEINNPTGFVSSNLKTLADYQKDTEGLIKQYRHVIGIFKKEEVKKNLSVPVEGLLKKISATEEDIDIDYILEDAPDLIQESKEGTERIKKIVMDLKDFAHPGEHKLQETDINQSIDSILNIVWNEIKYKAEVKKQYGELPQVICYPQQLNQVFMNLLVNGAQAIEDRGQIKILTRTDNGSVEIKIGDTGKGIPKENISKIFDPFFTTKEVGKGTGLGLNVAYNIIEKHKGTITVDSMPGKGTTFTIRIPVEGPG